MTGEWEGLGDIVFEWHLESLLLFFHVSVMNEWRQAAL